MSFEFRQEIRIRLDKIEEKQDEILKILLEDEEENFDEEVIDSENKKQRGQNVRRKEKEE